MRNRFEAIVSVIVLALVLFLLFVMITRAQTPEIVASGGQFALEKQVVAGGGNKMNQSGIQQDGTGGQTVAGTKSQGGQFTVYSGFWTPDDFAPTAANAVVSGRVTTSEGNGIRNVIVTLSGPNGAPRSVQTGAFGYFAFADVPVGSTYVLTVVSKRFSFTQSSQIVPVNDDVADLAFVADVR